VREEAEGDGAEAEEGGDEIGENESGRCGLSVGM
jgi:hypothetical protein